jgi:hypothetical protein
VETRYLANELKGSVAHFLRGDRRIEVEERSYISAHGYSPRLVARQSIIDMNRMVVYCSATRSGVFVVQIAVA